MRCLPLIVLAGSVLAASQPSHRIALPAKPKAPPAGSWARLCETPTARSSDLFGKPRVVGVKTCLIHHEQLDATSGTVRVAAGVEQTEGRQTLTIRVPPDCQPGAWPPPYDHAPRHLADRAEEPGLAANAIESEYRG